MKMNIDKFKSPMCGNYTCEKFTITGRICTAQSWGSNNLPRAAQASTANSLTESWSE
jgi:hypothetical protein